MDINYKIKQILVDKNISASHFADEIGVQRSSISHILAGRNRPSLDIIQKIIKRYPELGLDWILATNDSEASERSLDSSKIVNYPSESSSSRRTTSSLGFNGRKQLEPHEGLANSKNNADVAPKSIERILIFYTDGTFKDYTPGGD
jgi:transcriptional regulator with XRE-family HTH domain